MDNKNTVGRPLISVITVVFNGERYIEQTIQSIINQTFRNFEYIVIDGGSSDGTIDIIRKYENEIDYWVSEPDKGISDAFNKGLKASTGEYINFQGDGDGFVEPTSLERIVKEIYTARPKLISARIRRINEAGELIFISKQPQKFSKRSLLFKMSLPHQGLFVHKEFFDEYGYFDIHNKYCMDYEHLLRAYKQFPEVALVNDVVANWRADGLGNGKTLEIMDEYHTIKVASNVANLGLLIFIKYWNLLKYHLKKTIHGDK